MTNDSFIHLIISILFITYQTDTCASENNWLIESFIYVLLRYLNYVLLIERLTDPYINSLICTVFHGMHLFLSLLGNAHCFSSFPQHQVASPVASPLIWCLLSPGGATSSAQWGANNGQPITGLSLVT